MRKTLFMLRAAGVHFHEGYALRWRDGLERDKGKAALPEVPSNFLTRADAARSRAIAALSRLHGKLRSSSGWTFEPGV